VGRAAPTEAVQRQLLGAGLDLTQEMCTRCEVVWGVASVVKAIRQRSWLGAAGSGAISVEGDACALIGGMWGVVSCDCQGLMIAGAPRPCDQLCFWTTALPRHPLCAHACTDACAHTHRHRHTHVCLSRQGFTSSASDPSPSSPHPMHVLTRTHERMLCRCAMRAPHECMHDSTHARSHMCMRGCAVHGCVTACRQQPSSRACRAAATTAGGGGGCGW